MLEFQKNCQVVFAATIKRDAGHNPGQVGDNKRG